MPDSLALSLAELTPRFGVHSVKGFEHRFPPHSLARMRPLTLGVDLVVIHLYMLCHHPPYKGRLQRLSFIFVIIPFWVLFSVALFGASHTSSSFLQRKRRRVSSSMKTLFRRRPGRLWRRDGAPHAAFACPRPPGRDGSRSSGARTVLTTSWATVRRAATTSAEQTASLPGARRARAAHA